MKLARLSYNTTGWRFPSGDARKYEAGTYNSRVGFGNEEWLFRSEWLIGGWRYGFIQGVQKSHTTLIREGKPFDVTLFTLEGDTRRRRYVATISEVECLDEKQARTALDEYRRKGWFKSMQREIAAVGGDPDALEVNKPATDILNIRYRLDDLVLFPTDIYALPDDPINDLNRYQLFNAGKSAHFDRIAVARRRGLTELPDAKPLTRQGTGPTECSPEHARMQRKLMEELQSEYAGHDVRREEDFIDVSIRTESETLLFEIKSDLEPRSVIRHALGQILEYAFHPSRSHDLPVRLFIVGRKPLTEADKQYLARLRTDFNLPLEYRVVSL